MKKLYLLLAILVVLTGCTTDRYTMRNPKNKTEITCGGNTASSVLGGFVGYQIQKEADKECVNRLKVLGYKVENIE